MNKIKISLALSLLLASYAFAQNESDYVVTVKTNSDVIDTAGSFSIVNQNDIKSSNYNSVEDILENTVGINITANDRSIFGRNNVTFRGMDSRHTAILIDGKKISNTDANIGHSDFQYNWVAMEDIEKVEIIRGPMSSLYGSKALGGVVNIITKKPKNGLHGSLSTKLSYPQDKEGIGKDFSLYGAGKFDKFYFSLALQKQIQDIVPSTNPKDKTSKFEGKDITNADFKIGYEINENQDISLNIIRGKEIREVTLDATKDAIGNVDPIVHYDKYYDIDKYLYSLTYDRATHFGGFNIKGYISKSSTKAAQFSKTHEVEDKILSAEFYIDQFDTHYLIFGAEYKNEYYGSIPFKDTFSPVPGIKIPTKSFEDDHNNMSFYVQDEINIKDNFLLTIGGRFDNHEVYGNEFSPKLYLVYKLSDNQRIKLGYGRGFNAPAIKEMSDNYSLINPNAGHAFMGNSNLKPEIVNTYELGYEYFDDLHSIKATLFYNDISDLISTKYTGKKTMGIEIEQYSNIKEAYTRGLELELGRKELLKGLDVFAYYTFLDTKDKEQDIELNFKPKHKININVDYKITNSLQASLRYAYTGEQKNYRIKEGQMDKLDGFSTLGLQLSKNFAKNFNVRLGVDNLTNEKLEDQYNYQLRDRTYYLALDYKF